MKLETVTNPKIFAGTRCTACKRAAKKKQVVATVRIPNHMTVWTHKDCAYDILGPSDQEINEQWTERRNIIKENNGIFKV